MVGTPQLEAGDGEYTQDGTTDLHGNPILRSKRGGWRACSFVVVYEVFERMAYYGISSNLVLYLTTQLHQGTVLSANNVTNWVGTIWMTPVIGAYIADAHLGRYRTFMVASVIYLLVSCTDQSCPLSRCDRSCDDRYYTLSLSLIVSSVRPAVSVLLCWLEQ
jgi:dipeptide/tripeptide permease